MGPGMIKGGIRFALILACVGMAVPMLRAQTPADPKPQSQPAQPPGPATPQKPTQDANPFPEDNGSVPVLPNAMSPGTAAPEPAGDAADYGAVALPSGDADPVRSPDDAAAAVPDTGSSSSGAGLDELLRAPPDTSKKAKKDSDDDNGMRHDGPKEDETVGAYYLDQKNWKGALSRFESALVLDPENPDVYWGLGEAQRHLGDFASAKGNYLKVMEYDPDSKHAKAAKKILAEPEMSNAKAVSSNAAPGQTRP